MRQGIASSLSHAELFICTLAVLAWSCMHLVGTSEEASRLDRLPPPPVEAPAPPGWFAEHVAFALGNSGKVVGGPARWAIGGGLPRTTQPAEQTGQVYLDKPGQRLYFSDQRRHVWMVEDGQAWPIAGADELNQTDGPGQYAGFAYDGVYGGGHSGMVAADHTIYMLDVGRLRRIDRSDDGTWNVETVAGQGAESLAPGETAMLSDLAELGRGLAMDDRRNLYFTLAGGMVRATPDGRVSWLITPEKVAADMQAVYAKKWPDEKPPGVGLGIGEGVHLVWTPAGDVYGLGRTWPQGWKVTGEGQFVPLVSYGPRSKIMPGRWGEGDPGLYEVHCPMGTPGVWPGGQIIFQNEIPYATARYEKDRVSVLRQDGTWGLIPKDSQDYYRFRIGHPSFYPDGTVQCATPAPAPSGSIWIRLRKESEK